MSDTPLAPDEIRALLDALDRMTPEEQAQMLADLEGLDERHRALRARDDFLVFCHTVYPGVFKEGPHHRHMKPLLHDMAQAWPEHDPGPPHAYRLTVSMAPRFGKSETIAFLYVAWYFGHNPGHQVMMVTHTEDLSSGFGRKVRDMLDSPIYQSIFPDTKVSKDKSASGNWNTTAGGVYLALGVGGNAAGKGAHLLVCDDLVSEQAVLYGNPETAFETAWNYIQVGPLQRLMPQGRIIMIGCLTAETRVLLADGSEKQIKDIRAGDKIATYEEGRLSTSEVTNWIEHRPDQVYKIKTTSGKIVRANGRHPFLVDRDGSREWVRVRSLKVGDCMVQAVQPQGASGPSRPKACASCATDESCVQTDGSEPAALATGVSGVALLAPQRAAKNRPNVPGCATLATASSTGARENTASPKSRSAKAISSTVMAFLRRTMTACWPSKAVYAQYALAHQQLKTLAPAESPSSTSTTATTPTRSEGCSATTATLRSATPAPQNASWRPLDTYETTPDPIVEIAADGFEPVYDIEVARTENFIANGLVSHNTRWGKRDPIARAIKWSQDNPDALPWHEVRFPAVMDVEREGVLEQVSLWPEQWPLRELLAKKANMLPQFWAAQYMQEPTADEGALIKREYWKRWTKDEPPEVNHIIQVWDTAHETKSKSDYSACLTWGVWFNEATDRDELILLNAIKGRWTFPELKAKAREQYDQWEPEDLIVEKKAAGAPLIQELRAQGLFVIEVSPSRGTRLVSNDKYARVNAISTVFADGCVWAPETAWANEVIEACAAFPNGEHDDEVDCLVAGTQILMADGTQQPIEHVQVGQYVHTPVGPRRVLAAAPTGWLPTYRMQSGRTTLEGTANHPIATTRGWITLTDLKNTDTIKMVSIKKGLLCKKKSLFSRVGDTTVTLSQNIGRIVTTSVAGAAKGFYTAICGLRHMALFLMGTTCTTKTATPGTMNSIISSWYYAQRIGACTPQNSAGNAVKRSAHTWTAYAVKLANGTAATKGARGMKPTQQSTSEKGAWHSWLWPLRVKKGAKTLTSWYVWCVRHLSHPRSARPAFAATRACIDSVAPTNVRRPVFNLCVEDAHCFYANGVLTHNCTEMAVARYRQGGFLQLSDDEKDGDNGRSAPPRAAYY